MSTTDDSTSDGTTETGPIVAWVESQGWTKADVELLAAMLTVISLSVIAYSNLNKVID